MIGRSPSGRAGRASPEPASSLGHPATIPNAKLRYEFFTPHFRGLDLVWDFLCEQPKGSFSDSTLTIRGSYGYEQARDLKLFADGQQIGSGAELWERFAALAPVFHAFWNGFEQAATDWQEARRKDKLSEEAERKRRDDALCAKVLAAAAQGIEARRAETVEHGSAGTAKARPEGMRHD